MNKWKYLLPVAVATAGFWACSGESSSPTECTTEQCLIEKYGEFNADSANLANQQPTTTDPGTAITDNPAAESTSTGLAETTNPVQPIDSTSASHADGPAVVENDSISKNSYTSSNSTGDTSTDTSAVQSSAEAASETSSSSEAAEPPPASKPTFVEDHRSECQIGNIPTSVNNAKLPDPFMGLDGKRISSAADWKCRREEIGAMYEKLMFGEKPRNPEKVEGTYSGGKLTIKVTDKGKSGSFSVTISDAGTKDNPKPALIGFGGGMMGNSCGSLGKATDGLDIAKIVFNPDDVAPEKGGGMFFDIYGGNTNNYGTIIAWAWGVSRIIDVLEQMPEVGIDVHHLAMTGCSRWGKGALAVGAFDERIALTIPQESGSGGASLWRVGALVNKEKNDNYVQPLSSAGTEGKWMISSFQKYQDKENTLPFDQHMLVSMVAPRALLIIDNAGQKWLGEVPSNYCGQAGKEVFDALGVSENYTYSQEGGHNHCALPNGQFDEVQDFINKFLLGKDAKTGKIDFSKNTEKIEWKKSDWIDWETPALN